MFLSLENVMDTFHQAIKKQEPFSFVRLGDGENMILAQNTVFPIESVLKHPWAAPDAQIMRGITLPDYELRDRIIGAVKQATLVGLLSYNDKIILAPEAYKRPLTDRILQYYDYAPPLTCDACITRVMPQRSEFWALLRSSRVVLISRWAPELQKLLKKEPYGLKVPFILPFNHTQEIEYIVKEMRRSRKHYDVALISCGTNAVILSQKIAAKTGKVAIDFGKSAEYMVKGRAGLGFAPGRYSPHTL